MVTRRDFFKYTATGLALASVGNTKDAFASISKIVPDGSACSESEREIPTLAEVDIVVMGGAARGVESAIAAAKAGAKVFLIAELPYLGDEICGTLAQYEGLNETPRNVCHHYLYGLEGSLKTTLAVKLFKEGKEPPTPIHMKSVLENELIDAGVDFLYSSLLTNVLIDRGGAVSGVVITNRSGRQAIKAKAVIDATHGAQVAKFANAIVKSDGRKSIDFSFRVIGNQKRECGDNFRYELMPYPAKQRENIYDVSKYTLTTEIDISNYGELMDVEQQLRDNTFDPDQIDSSDVLEYLPPYTIVGKSSIDDKFCDVHSLAIEAFQPQNVDGITLVGVCGDCSNEIRSSMTIPDMMLWGEIAGVKLARQVIDKPMPQEVSVLIDNKLADNLGAVNEILNPLRPKYKKFGSVTSPKNAIPILGNYDVVIMGGGTAGASAGISAAKFGAKTLVIEYLHGLGGTGTFGMIGRYWDGYREGFTSEINSGVRDMAPIDHKRQKKGWKNEWPFDWKVEWYREQIRKNGGDIWFGVLGCGALVEGNKVTGVVVATPFGRGVILCDILIDSSGSADIAIAAGAEYNFIDKHSLSVQGAGLPKVDLGDHYNNSDWTFIDDTDILDVTRVFIEGKKKYPNNYDIGKLPQTRERRRVVGEYEVTTYDVINHRTYSDTISYHKSSFDTHGITVSPLFTLCPPEREHVVYEADVPLRSLLPKGLDGILVTGLGACADRDAMPVIRMQPCLQNQGYSVGYLSAMCIREYKSIRDIDIKKIQRYLVEIGNLPTRVLTDKNFKGFTDKELSLAVTTIPDNYKGFDKLLTQPQKGVKMINQQIKKGVNSSDLLFYASVTSILGDGTNADVVAEHIASHDWDTGWHYTGMGQFGECMGRIDSYILALGNSRRTDLLDVIIEKGLRLNSASYYSHIRAISEAFEAMGDNRAANLLYDLLMLPGMRYHAVESYNAARQHVIMDKIDVLNRNKSLKELTLARALYYCGDKEGLGRYILEQYANSLEKIYARYAESSLS